MFGPKLDSRSYTHLLLIVIASLLTINLIAQGSRNRNSTVSTDNTRSSGYLENSFTSEADATQELADATRDVAKANEEIADALREVADAISDLDLSVVVNNQGSSSRSSGSTNAAPRSPSMDDGIDLGGDSEAPTPQGTFNLN